MRPALRIARRELRGGLGGFRIFLACLALGVAAIAGIGTTREAIDTGLTREGATLLGGDIQLGFALRRASDAERAWMASVASEMSETLDFRSMAVAHTGPEPSRGLTQVRAVDGRYPLYGAVGLDPPIPLAEALAPRNGQPGAVMHPALMAQIGLSVGDSFSLGAQSFELRAALEREPDMAGGNFGLGPRTIVALAALDGSGLLQPGTLFDSQYRLGVADGADLEALKTDALARFGESGLAWRDARNAAPDLRRFIDRVGAFLALVGLAGLAVGGIGISASVRAYLAQKTATIATLKTLGASGRLIMAAYLVQIGLLTGLGVVIGLALGAVLPLVLAPLIEARLPVRAALGLAPRPLAEAALYGVLTALLFSFAPLARARTIRAAALYRQAQLGASRWPGGIVLGVTAGLAAGLVAAAAWLSGLPWVTLWAAACIGLALLVLMLVAWALRRAARGLARGGLSRGRPSLRLALSAIGGPASDTLSVVLSLGLGLSVLSAIGQIDTNLRSAVQDGLPELAPSYFFIDIQRDQLPGFLARLEGDPDVTRVETAPILRGIITRINDRPARDVAGDHWVLRGDRGVTYLPTAPPEEEITAGAWWPDGYDGPPLLAFAAEEAQEMGIGIGDRVTVNILGRDITATIVALREVDFSNAGIGFILTLSANALAGAPHTHIATVYAAEEAEPAILRDIASAAPNVTAIRVRDALDQVARALGGIADATSWAASITLLTGFLVLIGAAAAGQPARLREAAVLKTLGATRARIALSFALRAGLQGAAAGLVACVAGGLAGWAVMRFVMEAPFTFNQGSAAVIICGGAALNLGAGVIFAKRALATPPARILRAPE